MAAAGARAPAAMARPRRQRGRSRIIGWIGAPSWARVRSLCVLPTWGEVLFGASARDEDAFQAATPQARHSFGQPSMPFTYRPCETVFGAHVKLLGSTNGLRVKVCGFWAGSQVAHLGRTFCRSRTALLPPRVDLMRHRQLKKQRHRSKRKVDA